MQPSHPIVARGEVVLGAIHKSVPPRLWGRRVDDVVAESLTLAELATPLLTVDRGAVAHNAAAMLDWVSAHGLALAPHGKTTMAPELWARLLDAGAWALTLATPWQVQVARAAGVSRVLLANELVDPVAIEWVSEELDADPAFEFACWVDSESGLAAVTSSRGHRPIDVLVELGGAGGRTGVRGVEAAVGLAERVREAAQRTGRVRLVGVAGYEGSFGGDRTTDAAASVRAYLRQLVELADRLHAAELFDVARPTITAGGSAWFDLVAEAFAPVLDRMLGVVRSGAFQAHDDGFYSRMSPLGRGVDTHGAGPARLRPALRGWSRVLSRPEPTLAVLDAGRRDLPFDLDLPVPLRTDGTPRDDARITALNDQHAYLQLAADDPLAVGDVVPLGISHPCTAFDKWRLVPEIDDADTAAPRVVGFIETVF